MLPLPSAATDRGRFQTVCPGGGAPNIVTSYLLFEVCASALIDKAKTTKIKQPHLFMQNPPVSSCTLAAEVYNFRKFLAKRGVIRGQTSKSPKLQFKFG